MSFIASTDFLVDVAKGLVPGHSLVHKFGGATLTTTLAPVAQSGVYQTPIAATALEFVSDDVNDTAAGTGAREVTVIGLDASWAEVSQTVTTNGTTPVALGTNLIRLYRWYVSKSGSYASATATSHAGNLTIRVAGVGATWSTIPNTPLPFGQSQIGAYTVPAGSTAFLLGKSVFIDTTKTASFYFFSRCFADDVVAPFDGALRMMSQFLGVDGYIGVQEMAPSGPFPGPCDLGFRGVMGVGTGDAAVEFELLVIEDAYLP